MNVFRNLLRACRVLALARAWRRPVSAGRSPGPGVHRAVRQPAHRCVLGMPVSDLHRCGGHRCGGRRAGHAEPAVAAVLLRHAHPENRAFGGDVGAGETDRCLACAVLLLESGRAQHRSGRGRRDEEKRGVQGATARPASTWHVHYYTYPLLSWIGALLDLGCMESGRAGHRLGLGNSIRPGMTRNCRFC